LRRKDHLVLLFIKNSIINSYFSHAYVFHLDIIRKINIQDLPEYEEEDAIWRETKTMKRRVTLSLLGIMLEDELAIEIFILNRNPDR
jgi:hypothetical protein